MEPQERLSWDGKIAYKLYNHSQEHPFNPARSSSIGKESLLFYATDSIPVQAILILKLYRERDYAPVKMLARVGRCERIEAEESFEVECRFHELSPEQEAAVTELVEELEFIRRVHDKVKDTLQKNGISHPREKHGRTRS